MNSSTFGSVFTDNPIETDDICEIQLGGHSIHDQIQITNSPRTDIHNPIGSLGRPTGCIECPLTSMEVVGIMVMPQSQCQADGRTCGIWYRVSWQEYPDSISVLGWVSDTDEDIILAGNCESITMPFSSTYLDGEPSVPE
ncbi:MAG: hypothetical protein WBC91_07630 [Phototrophicaceae bacterium]